MKYIWIAFALILYCPNGLAQATIIFEQISGPENPFDGMSVGYYACPDFADIDGDGDMDAFFALEDGNVVYYQNTGNQQVPEFELVTGDDNPLHMAEGIAYAGVAFVDIDGDGDQDAFVSSVYAWIKFYENTGSPTNPQFVQQTGPDNPLDQYEEGFEARLSFVDIDGDNDQDVFIGDDYGVIRYYRNEGTASAAEFVEITGSENPLDQVYVGDFVKPDFADLDLDGDQDLILGEDSGAFHYFENTGNELVPEFTQITGSDNPFYGFNAGTESKPAFCDIDADGDQDLFAGNESGSIKYYLNKTTYTAVSATKPAGFSVAPNPFTDEIRIKPGQDLQNNHITRISIFNTSGKLVFATTADIHPEITLKLPSLKAGEYLIQFRAGEIVSVVKGVCVATN